MLLWGNQKCHVVSFNYGPLLKYLSCGKTGTQKACDRLSHIFKGLSYFWSAALKMPAHCSSDLWGKACCWKGVDSLWASELLSELHNWSCITQVPSTSSICELKFKETHSNIVKLSNNGSGYQLLQHRMICLGLFLGLGTTHWYRNTKSPEKKISSVVMDRRRQKRTKDFSWIKCKWKWPARFCKQSFSWQWTFSCGEIHFWDSLASAVILPIFYSSVYFFSNWLGDLWCGRASHWTTPGISVIGYHA